MYFDIPARLSHYAIGKGQSSLRHPVGLLTDPNLPCREDVSPHPPYLFVQIQHRATTMIIGTTAATNSVALAQSILESWALLLTYTA